MAISVQNLIKERKYPFIFSLFVLLVFVTFILLTSTQSPVNFTIDLVQSRPRSISSPPPLVSNPPVSNPSSATKSKPDHFPSNGNVTVVDGAQLSWKLCVGAVAVDYIPCLDNFKAIKELKSRRHMEHRERHCPKPSLRCLVPLPKEYKIPVPWPKSRDMVRYFDMV